MKDAKLRLGITSLAATVTAPTNIITNATDVTNIFCAADKWLYWGLITVSVIMFLYGGYIYATSEGNSENVRKGTKTLTFAVIGIMIALVAYGIPILIGSFFGVTSGLNACS